MIWTAKHPQFNPPMLGYLDNFISEADPRGAREQLDANYQHAGGWLPLKGFEMLPDGNLKYPGDPPTELLAETKLRNETIRFYRYAWVAVVQEDGSFEVCRMD